MRHPLPERTVTFAKAIIERRVPPNGEATAEPWAEAASDIAARV